MTRRGIGYFVHHQGRGHAERCAAIVAALPLDRPVTVFCAKPDVLPSLRDGVEVVTLPSLFEPTGAEATGLDHVPLPETLHCAPLGWPGIRHAMAILSEWFHRSDPALLVSDVSAEVAQFARLCSVPHVCVLQHGCRDDAGHRAAWNGAAGLLAPFDRALAQPDWPTTLLERTCFAPGLGVRTALPTREAARARLGISPEERVHLVMSGSGGEGFASAALGVGARTFPEVSWHTIGPIRHSWHATEPANLVHHGWVDDAPDFIAAADLVVGTAGNTVCQQVLAAGKPWIAIPEWCYFDEQTRKAEVLAEAGFARFESHLPSHAAGWQDVVTATLAGHRPERQNAAVRADADAIAANWLDALCTSLWGEDARSPGALSVVTIARGRETHLRNLIVGLARQSTPPAELVIGVMQPEPYADLPETEFPVRQIPIGGDDLPLAAARNRVARLAAEDSIAFLDVDCIPAPTFVADYAAHIRPGAGLLMGEVLYLPDGAADGDWTDLTLRSLGVLHDARSGPPSSALESCADYRCFWSLNFAMHRHDFEAAGGFDEAYTGYGGEDTDFARAVVERGIPLSWVRGGRAYHQFHRQLMPPVQHVAAVVRNAERFADKWGHRTMEHWLHAFELLGLIEQTSSGIHVVDPAPSIDQSLCEPQEGQPFASTTRVTERLEALVAERHVDEHGELPPRQRMDRKRFLHRGTGAVPCRSTGSVGSVGSVGAPA